MTRTVADSPSAGSVTSCELTMRPSSSTLSGTVCAAVAGLGDRTTSTTSDVPLSVERGVSTRRDLDVAREALLADADGEDGNGPRLQAGERLVERGVGRVGAVGDHDQPGERQPGQLVARALERRPEPRRRAVVFQIRRRSSSRSADEENRKKRRTKRSDSALQQRTVGLAELLLDELGARLPVAIGNRHAARVVEQDAEEVLLRHRGLQDQRGPKQAEQQNGHDPEPQDHERQRGRDGGPSIVRPR